MIHLVVLRAFHGLGHRRWGIRRNAFCLLLKCGVTLRAQSLRDQPTVLPPRVVGLQKDLNHLSLRGDQPPLSERWNSSFLVFAENWHIPTDLTNDSVAMRCDPVGLLTSLPDEVIA